MLGERARDWDDIPIDLIEKAGIILEAERQAKRHKLKGAVLTPVVNYDFTN